MRGGPQDWSWSSPALGESMEGKEGQGFLGRTAGGRAPILHRSVYRALAVPGGPRPGKEGRVRASPELLRSNPQTVTALTLVGKGNYTCESVYL